MNRPHLWGAAAALSLSLLTPLPAQVAHVPGEVLIAWREGPQRSAARVSLSRRGFQCLRESRAPDRPERWALPAKTGVAQALSMLRRNPTVRIAEPNLIRELCEVFPNDPLFATDQWNLWDAVGDMDIDATEAWEITVGSPEVVIALIDSGLDLDHPDLAGNLWVNPGETPGNGVDDDGNGYVDDVHGYDFAAGDGDPMSTSDHGTFVAGVAGMVGDNGFGGAGVCWQVSLMPLRVFGGSATLDDLIEAIDYAADRGADVINASYGGFEFSELEAEAYARAGDAGVIVVAAAGNDGIRVDRNRFYPATHGLPNLIAVGGSNRSDESADFTNFGANTVDVLAPSVPLTSTVNHPSSDETSGFRLWGGTSFAAPHVSGAAALVRSVHPSASPREVIERIRAGVDHPAAVDGATLSNGRLSAVGPLAADAVAPGAVTDLRVRDFASLGARVLFTAPGDDGAMGTPARWDVRVDTEPLTEESWDAAPRAWDIPLPAAGGTTVTLPLSRVNGETMAPSATFHVGVRAVDEVGNLGPLSNLCTVTTAGVTTLFFDDFESDSGAWSADAPWTRTDQVEAFSGNFCYHDSVAGAYAPNTDISLTLATPLDLSGAVSPELSFAMQHEFAQSPGNELYRAGVTLEDGGAVEVSTDGAVWERVETLYLGSFPYRRTRVPLSRWEGSPQVWIRWRLFSDSNGAVGDGWWIDDVHVCTPHLPLLSTPDLIIESVGIGQAPQLPGLYTELSGPWEGTSSKSRVPVLEANSARAVSAEVAASATFRPWLPVAGLYEVAAAWGEDANASDVTWRVSHAEGVTALTVDQDGVTEAALWIPLGEFEFDRGQGGAVTLDTSSVTGSPRPERDAIALADAVRWRLITPREATVEVSALQLH
ncbi:S8 family serine peptidase [Candidatus Sumerlaeota bacterium]|nr:S8 family serine peptidase [Candidatus Sumerlaeota bacterium]